MSFTVNHILDWQDFVQKRPDILPKVIAARKKRRVTLDPAISFMFENSNLLWWHMQEMCRSEKGGEAQKQEEWEVFSPLIPQPFSLVATMMIEYTDLEERRKALRNLLYIEQHISMVFPEGRLPAESLALPHTDNVEKTYSVHFLRFSFDTEEGLKIMQNKNFSHTAPFLESTHPYHKGIKILSDTLWEELAQEVMHGSRLTWCSPK